MLHAGIDMHKKFSVATVVERTAASMGTVSRFETEILAQDENIDALPTLNSIWVSNSADGWRKFLSPIVDRYKYMEKKLYLRGDAAFAIPDI